MEDFTTQFFTFMLLKDVVDKDETINDSLAGLTADEMIEIQKLNPSDPDDLARLCDIFQDNPKFLEQINVQTEYTSVSQLRNLQGCGLQVEPLKIMCKT